MFMPLERLTGFYSMIREVYKTTLFECGHNLARSLSLFLPRRCQPKIAEVDNRNSEGTVRL